MAFRTVYSEMKQIKALLCITSIYKCIIAYQCDIIYHSWIVRSTFLYRNVYRDVHCCQFPTKNSHALNKITRHGLLSSFTCRKWFSIMCVLFSSTNSLFSFYFAIKFFCIMCPLFSSTFHIHQFVSIICACMGV